MLKALTIWRERLGMNDTMTPLIVEIQHPRFSGFDHGKLSVQSSLGCPAAVV